MLHTIRANVKCRKYFGYTECIFCYHTDDATPNVISSWFFDSCDVSDFSPECKECVIEQNTKVKHAQSLSDFLGLYPPVRR